MIAPYWRDERTRLYLGDAHDTLTQLPSGYADCVVTSPPYWGGVRDYGMPGQYGGEPTIGEYVSNLTEVLAEVRRVLADDGTCWLNLGDRYLPAATDDGLARKSLAGVPWRVVIALQDSGWMLRNALVWNKPNALPSSARDRFTCRYEMVFLLVKQEHYYFNLDPLRVRRPPHELSSAFEHGGGHRQGDGHGPKGKYADPRFVSCPRQRHNTPPPTGRRHTAAHALGRNPGDVWTIPTRPFTRAHFAVFPLDLPVRAIAAGCRTGGKVLDPFCGAGTTLVAARKMGRPGVGIDLHADYLDLTAERIREMDPYGGKGGPQ